MQLVTLVMLMSSLEYVLNVTSCTLPAHLFVPVSTASCKLEESHTYATMTQWTCYSDDKLSCNDDELSCLL